MTQHDEQRVLEMADTVQEMRDSLLGSLDGKTVGALPMLKKVCETVYSPENPDQSHEARLRKIEQRLDELADLKATKERLDSLENWRTMVVGGALVSWVVFTVLCYIAYDWAREHLTTVIKTK